MENREKKLKSTKRFVETVLSFYLLQLSKLQYIFYIILLFSILYYFTFFVEKRNFRDRNLQMHIHCKLPRLHSRVKDLQTVGQPILQLQTINLRIVSCYYVVRLLTN